MTKADLDYTCAETEIDNDSNPPVVSSAASLQLVKTKLILRDSLAFVILVLATAVLYGITSLLFRSFAERRDELARQYAKQGRAALQAGQADHAIRDLRSALSYAPDERSTHLLLAEALAEAHHTEEATDYFLSLWETQPADGFINLQLARLSRQKHDRAQAISYYRAAISGSWDGDSVSKRRIVQLELSDYLIEKGEFAAARGELLSAAANSPETPALDLLFGDKLLEVNHSLDAMNFYKKAIALQPHNPLALYKAGRLAYETGDYGNARKLLALAQKDHPSAALSQPELRDLDFLAENSDRVLHLTLSSDLPARVRAEHIVTAAGIAKHRFDSCAAHFASLPIQPRSIDLLKAEWQSAMRILDRPSRLESADDQDNMTHLVFDTEIQTEKLCGAPTGDDALLLSLAHARPEAQ